MTRRVHQFDAHVADHHHVARIVDGQVAVGQLGHLLHVGGLGLLHMDLHVLALEEPRTPSIR